MRDYSRYNPEYDPLMDRERAQVPKLKPEMERLLNVVHENGVLIGTIEEVKRQLRDLVERSEKMREERDGARAASGRYELQRDDAREERDKLQQKLDKLTKKGKK